MATKIMTQGGRIMNDDKKAGDLGGDKVGRSRRGRKGRRCKVVSMEDWCKNRARGEAAAAGARENLSPEEIPFLARAQKAAFLLKFILSDYTTDRELDELVLSAAHCAERVPP
jgi:hypothetical protein